MFKVYISCLLLISLTACKDKKPEVVDLNDIVDSSDRYAEGKEPKKDSIIVHWYDSLMNENKLISDTLGLNEEEIEIIDSTWLPDRFVSKNLQKWTSNSALVSVWNYSDSLAMKNALFNWLDCFGKNCISIQLLEEKKLIPQAFVIYALENKVIYLESPENINTKLVLQNLNRMFPKGNLKYVITQSPRGKVQWWKLEKSKWTVIKKEEI